MFERVLLPTDGSAGVERALECAAAIAARFGAKVYTLFVVEPIDLMVFYEPRGVPQAPVQDVIGGMHKLGEEIVGRTAKELSARGAEDVDGEIRDGHPAETILAYAEEVGADLIVMGTHGRRGLNRVLLGSVAEEVVRAARVPVMTVRMSP